MSGTSEPATAVPAGSLRRLHLRYLGFALGLCAFVLAMGVAERLGVPNGWIGAAFMAGTILVYATIGFFTRTSNESEYYVAGRRVPALYNGMATAADWMSVASFIGTAGVLYLQGFGGLAYIIGWTGGYCLLALLLAPYLRRLPVYTVADFLGQRYGGVAPRLIGALATVGLVLLSAVAGGLLLRHQGFGAMRRIRAEMEAGRDPGRQLAHGAMIVLAAALLIVPGFLTDILGLLLFLPPVRDLAWRFLKSRVTVVSGFGMGGGARRRPERTIDLDSEDFARKPDPDSPWRRLGDD